MGTSLKGGTRIMEIFVLGQRPYRVSQKSKKANEMCDEHLHWYQWNVLTVPQGMRGHIENVRIFMK